MGSHVDYWLTERGETALRHPAGVVQYDGGGSREYYLTDTGAAVLAAAEQEDPSLAQSARQHELETALARLEELFPAFTIWFAKISQTTTVWTATHPKANGAITAYSPTELEERLVAVAARVA